MRKLLTLFIIVLTVTLSYAQTGRLTGKVIDEDGLPLAGANVYLEKINKGAATDKNGVYNIFEAPEGTYTLRVSYIGFQPESKEVTVEAGKTLEADFTLKAGVVMGDEVQVIGDRLKGQAKALNQQMMNNNITNIVSSDLIGRFPDQNIGDVLKRIPSLSVYYDQGEARFVNIRGTEPRLNSIMINGERIPSAEAEIRNVQVDLIPSNMIQTIEVNKAITPDMDADAIGGAVNLITRGAPNGLRVSGTLGSGYNFLSEKPMLNGAFVLGNRFADNKLGVVLSGSYYDHNLGSHNSEGEWDKTDNGTIYANEWDIRTYEIRRLRQSFSGALDYKFSPSSTVYFNAMYNHRNDWENRYRLRYKLDEPNDQGIVEESELIRETKGGLNNDANDNARLEDQRTLSLSLSGDHVLADFISMDWGAHFSKASEERPNERYIAWNVKDIPVTPDISDTREPHFSVVNEGDAAFSEYGLDELTEEYQWTEEKDYGGRLNFKIPFNNEGDYKNTLKVGGKFRQKDKERDNNFFEYEPVDEGAFGSSLADVSRTDKTNDDFLAGDYKAGEFTNEEFLGNLDLDNSTLFNKEDKPGDYAPDNFTATEKVTAGYVMWEQNFGPQWLVIAGVRLENTQVDYKGNEYNDDTDEVTPTAGDDSYMNILPGVHIKYHVAPKTILRFAWTNTIARPNYYDLVPYRNIAVEDEELEIGNPALEPTTSMNFDFMAEHYFENIGILSGGLFYKDIKDYIYVYNQEDYVDPISGNTYELFQPRNGATASILGFEAALQRQLDFLPGILGNLGFYFNYTYSYSTADNPVLDEQVDGDEDIELPGTSPHTLNANLTYQDKRLVLGVSFNFTAAYIDPDEMDLTPGLERYYDDATYLDINGSYAFTDQFRFFVEVNNLLNQPLRFYAGDKDRTYQAEFYNMRMQAGVKFDL